MTAKYIKKALKGKRLTFVNAERIANELGYSVVFFNTLEGDIEVIRYELQKECETQKSFVYSETAKIIFIDGALHSGDKLNLLLHEIGHIILGHVGDGNLIIRNKILIDIEADHFAYQIIYGEKKTVLYILIASILLSTSIIFGAFHVNKAADAVPVYSEATVYTEQPTETQSYTSSEAVSETVYVTPSGTKFHRSDCRYVKSKNNLTELTRTDAVQKYTPCSVCKP